MTDQLLHPSMEMLQLRLMRIRPGSVLRYRCQEHGPTEAYVEIQDIYPDGKLDLRIFPSDELKAPWGNVSPQQRALRQILDMDRQGLIKLVKERKLSVIQ